MEPVTVTVKDACRAIGVCHVTIYAMLADGRLDSITLGRRRLITTESIRRLVADAIQSERTNA